MKRVRGERLRPLSAERRALAAEWFKLASRLASKYLHICGDSDTNHDEILSAARWGVVRAASTWGEGVSFERWAVACIRSEILDCLRRMDEVGRWTRDRMRLGIEPPRGVRSVVDLDETLPAADRWARAEAALDVEHLLSALAPRKADLIARVYLGNAQQRDEGRRIGLTESRVSQLVTEAMVEMRHAGRERHL